MKHYHTRSGGGFLGLGNVDREHVEYVCELVNRMCQFTRPMTVIECDDVLCLFDAEVKLAEETHELDLLYAMTDDEADAYLEAKLRDVMEGR